MKKRLLGIVLVSTMITSLCGCAKKTETTTNNVATPTTQAVNETVSEGGKEEEVVNDKPYAGTKLTYWVDLNSSIAASYTNAGDTEWAKEVERQTGIDIEFIHPTIGSADEEFAILCASGEYPDIIQYTWTKYTGGADAAIDDGIIIALDDLIENNSPNLKKLLDENPDVDKMIKSGSGHYYVYPFLRGLKNSSDNLALYTSAFTIRKDFLDKLNLEIPETIQEWDTVLRAFKDNGIEVPFCTRSDWMLDVFSAGFDNWGNFYVEDGVVKNGIIEDSRKEFLQQMNIWYKDGLIDNDYLVATKQSNQTYFTTGKSAAVQAPLGQGLGTYTQILHEQDPEITEEDIVACPPVTSTKGKNAKFSKVNNVYDASAASAAITTACKNKEAAAWLLDWMFSDAGYMAGNYGVEGVSYEMINGKPVFTDLMQNNPDGLTFDVMLAKYTGKFCPRYSPEDLDYFKQYYVKSNQQNAYAAMMKTDMLKYCYPVCATVLAEDSERATEITSYINTYKDEMEAKFVAGDISFDEWDSYVEKIKSFGYDELVQIKQRAYDNYINN